MPNRVIYDGILDSDRINSLTAEEERFFLRLLLVIDDYGCFDGRTARIASACFPIRQVDLNEMEAIIEKLEDMGLICRYIVKSKTYLQVVNFRQNTRRMKHRYPTYQQSTDKRRTMSDNVGQVTDNVPPETETETETETEVDTYTSFSTDEESEKEIPDSDESEERIGSTSDSPGKKKPAIPYKEIVDIYNTSCPSLPVVTKITEKRKKHLGTLFREAGSLDALREYFRKANASDFLSGKKTKWKAGFDWLINHNNFVKVMEGNYDNRASPGNSYQSALHELYEELEE